MPTRPEKLMSGHLSCSSLRFYPKTLLLPSNNGMFLILSLDKDGEYILTQQVDIIINKAM